MHTTSLIYPWSESEKKKFKMGEYFWWRHRLCNCGGMDKKCVLEQKNLWAFTNSLILNHLTSNFPQYFFDRSLIRIRKKNQNGGNFLMTSWHKNAVMSWQLEICKKKNLPNWSYIIFRKSQKISGQTRKGFSKYATKYTAAGPLPPPPSLCRVNNAKLWQIKVNNLPAELVVFVEKTFKIKIATFDWWV